jgi:hypothetical protein
MLDTPVRYKGMADERSQCTRLPADGVFDRRGFGRATANLNRNRPLSARSSGRWVREEAMSESLYRELFGVSGLPIGEAVRRPKGATPDRDVRRSWILLGDPTTRLR